MGDLGNIEANMNGIARQKFQSVDMHLNGPLSVLGRSCVIHKNEDDLGLGGLPTSKFDGNSGLKIGCGVIGFYPENKKSLDL